MKHKNTLRIILRKLVISGLFGVAFFIATQTQAANPLTISSLTSSYQNYVVTAPKISTPAPTLVGATPQDGNNSINKLLTSLQAQTISSLTSAYQNYVATTTPSSLNISSLTSARSTSSVPTIDGLSTAYKSYITPGSVPNTTQNAIVVVPPKTTPIAISPNIKTTPLKVATATISDTALISAMQRLLADPNVASQLRGPAGATGPTGPAGTNAMYVGQPAASRYQPAAPTSNPVVFLPVGVTQPDLVHGFSGGAYFSVANLSSNLLTTETANVTDINVSGNSTLKGALSVTGNTSIGGSLSVGGTILSSGASTISGALTLDDNFTQTGAHTFSTGTGLISLNGNTAITGTGSLTVGGQTIIGHIPTLAHAFSPAWPAGTSNVADSALYINPATATTDTNLLGVAVGGVVKFLVDADGNVYANNLVLTGSTTSGATTVASLLVLGNFSQTGASTFSTGTGAVSLNGDTTIATGKNLTLTAGNITLSSGTINKLTITPPATGATLTIADGKTFTVNNSLTLAGTDTTTMTFPTTSATIARTDAGQIFTGVQTMTSPALTTPAITGLATGTGVATANTVSTLVARDSSGNFSAGTITATTFSGAVTGHSSLDLPLAGGTLTGNLLFSTDNTLDIGATGATRPRTGYFGTSIISPVVNATTGVQINGAATSGTILRGNSTNYVPTTSTFADTYAASNLLYSNGASTVTGLATANSGVLVTSSTGVPSILGPMTNGQLVVGSTGATPVLATLTGTTDQVVVTNGAGTITLSIPQSINTTSTPQFTRMGLGVAADTTNILTVTSTSVTDLSKGINISHAGAVAGTGYAGYFSKTGASTTNIGLYTTATGATNNKSLYVDSAVAGANNYTIYAAGAAKNFFAGNIGIGETAPGTNLSVLGGAAIGSTTAFSQAAIPSGNLAIQGNVGIGTTSPLTKLSIQGTAGANDLLNVASSTGASALYVNAAGNVGIGTASPQAKLDISNQTAGINALLNLSYNNAASSGGKISWSAGGSTETAKIQHSLYDNSGNTAGDLAFSTYYNGLNSSPSMVIKGSGNVGIGTTSPSQKLSVGSGNLFNVSSLGNITSAFTTLDGSSTANGAGSNSNTLILTSATNFDVGNYVKVAATACTVNPCYAKITAIATNTLTISPALSWSNTDVVTEVTIPEIGGTGLTNTLANRYGRGYFIDGIVTGNGSTYYTDANISATGTTFNFLNDTASGVTALNIGKSATLTTIIGTLKLTGLSTDSTTIGIPGVMCLSTANEVVKLSGVATCIISSARFKHDIAPSTVGLDLVNALRPVTFTYNNDTIGLGQQFGFIAEDVQALDPRLVVHGTDGLPFSVRYENLTAVLTKAIQEMDLNINSVAGTVVPVPGSASETFVTAFFTNIKNKIGTWLADAANGIGNIFANQINTKTLCVSDDSGAKTCLTKAQLDTLLGNANGSVVNNVGAPVSSPPNVGGVPASGGGGIVSTPAPEGTDSTNGNVGTETAKAAADLAAQKIADEKAAADAAAKAAADKIQAEADAKAASVPDPTSTP